MVTLICDCCSENISIIMVSHTEMKTLRTISTDQTET